MTVAKRGQVTLAALQLTRGGGKKNVEASNSKCTGHQRIGTRKKAKETNTKNGNSAISLFILHDFVLLSCVCVCAQFLVQIEALLLLSLLLLLGDGKED